MKQFIPESLPPDSEPISYEFHEKEETLPVEMETAFDWIQKLVERHDAEIRQLHYIFCDDHYIQQVNKKVLNHDYATDILTFPYGDNEKLSGEILISTERVRDNGMGYASGYRSEFLRVLIHGVLHLLGYRDKSDEEKTEMRSQENQAIALFDRMC